MVRSQLLRVNLIDGGPPDFGSPHVIRRDHHTALVRHDAYDTNHLLHHIVEGESRTITINFEKMKLPKNGGSKMS